jgi:hypothetical protein
MDFAQYLQIKLKISRPMAEAFILVGDHFQDREILLELGPQGVRNAHKVKAVFGGNGRIEGILDVTRKAFYLDEENDRAYEIRNGTVRNTQADEGEFNQPELASRVGAYPAHKSWAISQRNDYRANRLSQNRRDAFGEKAAQAEIQKPKTDPGSMSDDAEETLSG